MTPGRSFRAAWQPQRGPAGTVWRRSAGWKHVSINPCKSLRFVTRLLAVCHFKLEVPEAFFYLFFKARKSKAEKPFSCRKHMRRRPPLTLVGSPPVIHLLQWKFNTMDPRLSFLAVGQKTKTQHAELGGSWSRRVWSSKKRGSKCLESPGAFLLVRAPSENNEEKVVSSNSCFPKWS